MVTVAPCGRVDCHVLDDARDRVADRAEIASLHIGVDVDHRHDRVVRDQPRRAGLRDAGQAADDLRLDVGRIAVALVDRDGFKVVDAAELILRRLDVDQMRDAVRRVEPVGRCDLAAARQDGEGVVGDIRLGQAGPQGEGAPRREQQSRLAHDLLDADVGDAGDLLQARRQLAWHRRSWCRGRGR